MRATLRRRLRDQARQQRNRRAQVENLEMRWVLSSSSLSIADSSLIEGQSGTTNMVFTVTRSGDLTSQVTAGYSTVDGTALAGTDYLAQSGTVIIPANSASATISIPIIGDTIPEANKTFSVVLSAAIVDGSPVTAGTASPFSLPNGVPATIVTGDFNLDGHDGLAEH